MSAWILGRIARFQIVAAIGGVAIALPMAAASWADERIVLHASYAVFGDRAFIDVDALAEAVGAARLGMVDLRVCGVEALAAFKRTAPYLGGGALQPQIVDATDAACRAPAVLPAAATRAFAANGEAVAVAYWSQVAP